MLNNVKSRFLSGKNIFILLAITSLLFFVACEDKSDLTAPSAPNTGTADFTRFVAIGNSLTAGKQNNSVYETSQVYSFSKMIAEQVGVSFEQPLIQNPGIGGRIDIVSLDPFKTETQDDNETRLNGDYAGIYNNLGIPGILLPDVLLTKESPSQYVGANAMIDAVLRKQGHTVLELAIASQPTFATLWIGNNDILGYATSGGILPHTPVADFATAYNTLTGALAQAGIPVVVANIPNVRDVPFFITVSPKIGYALEQLQAANPAIQGLAYQMTDAPYVGLASIDDLKTNKILLTLKAGLATDYIGDKTGAYYKVNNIPIPATVDTQYPFGLTPQNPFPNQFVLDLAEQKEVETVTTSFNNSIASAVKAVGFHLVDINSFFNGIAKNGIVANGIQFSTTFVKGGIFSLDGVHPTSQGYAIIANEFIKVINSKFSASIPQINVSTIPGSLELAKHSELNKIGIPVFEKGTFDNYLY